MSEPIVYREYASTDFDRYKQLYKAVFSKDMSSEHFNWKFQSNKMDAVIFCAVTGNGELVGSRAVLLTEVRVGKQLVKAAQSVDSMVHPDYQGKGIYKQLNLHAIEALKSKGVSMIMTFPNHNSLPPLQKLGWEKVAPVSIYAKVLRYQSLARGSRKFLKLPLSVIDKGISFTNKRLTFDVTQVNEFAGKHKEFINSVLSTKYHQDRSEDFLEWKYSSKPEQTYTKLVFSKKDAIQGICVIRIDSNHEKTSGVVTEFITMDDTCSQELMQNLLTYSKTSLSIDILKLWEVENSVLSKSLRKNHFIKKQSAIYFAIKPLSDLNEDGINDASNWYLSWGDADTA